MKSRTSYLVLVCSALLVACTRVDTVPTAPADLPIECRTPDISGTGRLQTIDPQESLIRILAFRSGRLARLGHNHVIVAPSVHGFAIEDEDRASSFTLCFSAVELIVDDPDQRDTSGEEFAGHLDQDTVAATRANMLSERQLQADLHPYILVSGRTIGGNAEMPLFELSIQVRDHLHVVSTTGHVEREPQGVVVNGALTLRQTDLGIEPFSALFGALTVDDELQITYRIRTIAADRLESRRANETKKQSF